MFGSYIKPMCCNETHGVFCQAKYLVLIQKIYLTKYDYGIITIDMKMAAGKFKAECLKLMDYINSTHEEIIVTKHGKPVVKVVPISKKTDRSLFGYLKDSIRIQGDIIAPIDEKWDVHN